MRSQLDVSRFVTAALALLLTSLAWTVPGEATIAIKFDVAALTSSADEVVLGKVMTSQSRWDKGRIVTEVDIQVALPVLGQAQEGQRLRVRSYGGRVGDLAQVVPGAAHFGLGDHVFVFLDRHKASQTLRVVGLSQGRYQVYEGPDAQLWGSQNLEGLSLAQPQGKDEQGRTLATMIPESETAQQPLPLQALIQEVARSAKLLQIPLRPEVTARFGQDLTQRYDLRQDLRKLPVVTPVPQVPVTTPSEL